jgi:H+/gluconate symporter-like permease
MEWIGPIGILVALAIIVVLAMKGYNILIVAPLCALLVIITNRMDVFGALLTDPNSYMSGLAGFVLSLFLVFLLGAILAKVLDDSGAAKSIAKAVLKITGTEKPFSILVAMFIISALLTFGGVSLFVAVFAIVPLARPVFKEMNIPWHLAAIPIGAGMCSFTMSMIPGSPQVQNIIPTAALGTTLTAAPLVGAVSAICVVVFFLWYMKYELNKALKAGENYVETGGAPSTPAEEKEMPSLGISLAPMIVLIAIIFIGSFMKIPNVILIGLSVAIIVGLVLCWNYMENALATVNTAATSSVGPMMLIAAAVGFGGVVAAAPGFKVFGDWLTSLPGNPLISLSAITMFFSCVTGSASGALGIVMKAFAPLYLSLGAHPEAIHRIAAIASGFGALPHSGIVLAIMAVMGLTHKDAYRHLAVTIGLSVVVALIPALILAIIIY